MAGIRTPLPIEALRERMPSVYAELLEIATRLERHYKDMQDIEFTVQEGTPLLMRVLRGLPSCLPIPRRSSVYRDVPNSHEIVGQS